MSTIRKRSVLGITLAMFLCLIFVGAVCAQVDQTNVGLLRLASFKCPKQVLPDIDFQASIDVRYAISGPPNNATIRAAVYSGDSNVGNPIWQSTPQVVVNGGDKVWNMTFRSPITEGDLRLTAWAYYLYKGSWSSYSNSTGGPSFSHVTIKVSRTAVLTVLLGVPDVAVAFDSTSVKTASNGYAQMSLLIGNSHVVSIPPSVELQNSTRLVFRGWTDGNNQTQRTILLGGDSMLVGSYKIQYLLKENSIVSDYSHSSWYDAGANVSLQVAPTVAGFLGLRYVFTGWSGDVGSYAGSTSTIVNLSMDKPRDITAIFAVDYSPLIIPVILVIGTAGGVLVAILNVRKRGSRSIAGHDTVVEKPVRFCDGCGEPVEGDWTHCVKCGRELPPVEGVES